MSEFASTSAMPSYVTRLALKSAPFHEVVDAQIFYNGAQIQQSFNLIQHLLSSSNQIVLLQAASGVGKTCLLTQLHRRSKDSLRLCLLQGQYAADLKTVLFQCLRDFGVTDGDSLASESSLKSRLVKLRELGVQAALLIDDADKLLPDVSAKLAEWLAWQHEGEYLLQAVVCCQQASSLVKAVESRIQTVDLQSLTEAETPAYLLTRLQSVGFKGELPFTKKDLKRLFNKSKGNPALLNKLAHQTLLGVSSPLPSSISTVKNINFASLLRMVGASILVVAIIVLLLFQDSINSLFEADTTVEEKIIEIPEQQDDLAKVVVDEPAKPSSEQTQRDELLGLLDELETKPKSKPKPVPITKKPPVIVNDEIKQVDVQSTDNSAIHQKQWIMQQKTTDYTFQLMGTWDHQELKDFIDKYALTGDVAEFESVRNGRTWYVLIYGVYKNKQTALKASKAWPAPLNTLPSWLRRFDSVQKQIKKD